MSETTTNPQPSEPPVSGTGSGGSTAPTSSPDVETADAPISDPPTSGSGSGGSS